MTTDTTFKPGQALTSYGPIQLANRLGLTQWQVARARTDGLIPAPSGAGRWPAAAVDEVAERADAIRTAVGSVPNVGANRAEDYLAERFCMPVPGGTAAELATMGLLPVVGDYKGHTLYCGRTLEAFADRAALEDAAVRGRLLTRVEAARHLTIRDCDFAHLVRAGLVTPRERRLGPFQSRRARPTVPLYRAGDLDALSALDDIDWAAVRATPAGSHSPLAKLPTAKEATL
ncbi:hypothetical protein [Actinomadura rubrisoli]|uniref:Uncharacterized protein n=1 Tax=Actinomadura rubrisoli TaxID=2530368 RepID=A0A4R5CFI2_9ACTN|nr:hypothetical protein [Actinomadura rubrisoli]TDD97726.1 hypothetical protein E1298_01430 [Actinomadura rubrisoli]